MSAPAGFVWDPRLASHVYRSDHPLKPWRLQGVHDTLERLGAFTRSNARLLAPRLATRQEIERVHDPRYVDAIERASADPGGGYADWGLSEWGDTPPFQGMHEASLLTTGASLVATTVSGIGPTPTFCRVNGTIAPKLNFELRLPEHWNGKLHYAGGGGYNGSIPPLAGAPLTALKQGYATVSSDSGHQASAVDASFALKDANAAQLFGSLAVPSVMSATSPPTTVRRSWRTFSL